MSTQDQIWHQVHELFEADDGSLPEFAVSGLTPECVVRGYELLVDCGTIVSRDVLLHERARGLDIALEDVPDPARQVVAGCVDPFHVVLGAIRYLGAAIPDLGIGVFPSELILDYRMGAEWTPQTVEGLFRLLHELSQCCPSSIVRLEEGVSVFWIERFQRAWAECSLRHGDT